MPNNNKNVLAWTKFAMQVLAVFWMDVFTSFDVLKVKNGINEGKNISAIRAFSQIYRMEGLKGMYTGLSAAAHQFSYTTSRLGLYDVFTSKLIHSKNKNNNNNNQKSPHHLSMRKNYCVVYQSVVLLLHVAPLKWWSVCKQMEWLHQN